jgi:glycogen debranching enzyme
VRNVLLVSEGIEGNAAWEWLESLDDVSVERYSSTLPLKQDAPDVVWVHGSGPAPEGLGPWLVQGGRLLATLDAVSIPSALRIEPTPPNEIYRGTWRHADDEFWLPDYRSFKAFPHIRGMAAFGSHPLFAGIDQGTYTWAPSERETFSGLTYHRSRPKSGSVVAVERSFIHLNPERIVAWEYPVEEGGILCIGAFVHLAAPDRLFARQLRTVLANAIIGDAIPHRDRALPVTLWPEGGRQCRRSTVPVPSIPSLTGRWVQSVSDHILEGPVSTHAPWTLAGRRMLLTGDEKNGLVEAWGHPVRVMKAKPVLLNGAEPVPLTIRVAPEEVIRVIKGPAGSATERWTTALERPALVWEIDAEPGIEVRASWSVDLRRMWPYPAGAYGDLRWNITDAGDRVWVGASGGSVQLVFSVQNGHFHTVVERQGVPPSLELTVEGRGLVRIVAVAALDSNDLATTLTALARKNLDGIQRQRAQHAEQVHAYGAGIETPDTDLACAFEWAKVRADSFVAETPGLGRSLLAGYASSRPGWGDGRPGYGWYFGRDACWTGFAQLAVGQREPVRDVIRFLSIHQDVSGKVLHEYTTSGLAHYDAADSTPLYLLLVARFAAWTGDIEFLRKYWTHVERAYRFCLETDTDDDGLIENTRVGHGWIEHGPLGGSHVTLYLAACWCAALEELAPIADAMGRADLSEEMRGRASVARQSIERRLRADGEYALGLDHEGKPSMHRTAMLAVPLLLGVANPAHSRPWLDAIAKPGFSTPWGVRMVSAEDPLFDPEGYHLGSVWPLYTGWVSLAEWRTGRYPAALDHLLINARIYKDRARGAFDEVLHGKEYRNGGICPDQAWSAAMVLSPVIEGLWGVSPCALEEAVTVAPWLPPHWARMSLRRLRVGRTVLDIELRRRPGQLITRVTRSFGPGLQFKLAPRTEGSPLNVMVDDVSMGGTSAQFQVRDQHEVIFSF